MSALTKSIIAPAVIGSCLYYSKTLIAHIYSTYISPRMYSCITIHSTDIECFEAVLEFIETKKLISANHLVVCEDLSRASDEDAKLKSFQYQPANTGEPLFMKYGGRTICMKRVKESSDTMRREGRTIQIEKLLFSVFGSDLSSIKLLMANAIEHKNKGISKNTQVFMCDEQWADKWDKIADDRPRTLESVILEKTLSRDTLHDMHTFLVSKEWYHRMDIPYRRGYLFHGPPGNGKTSLCRAFAGELEMDICILSLSSTSLTDSKLINILRRAPARSLIVLEDVDAIFVQRNKSAPDSSSKLSFSGLLNAIDGVVSQEGRIFIMTTNHVDQLDPALIRPGRCDVKLEVRNASREQLVAMFTRFFPEREADAQIYAGLIPENIISMAQIQNHLLEHKNSPEKAIETAVQLKPDNASQ
jgi:chaperone BCS1